MYLHLLQSSFWFCCIFCIFAVFVLCCFSHFFYLFLFSRIDDGGPDLYLYWFVLIFICICICIVVLFGDVKRKKNEERYLKEGKARRAQWGPLWFLFCPLPSRYFSTIRNFSVSSFSETDTFEKSSSPTSFKVKMMSLLFRGDCQPKYGFFQVRRGGCFEKYSYIQCCVFYYKW